MFKVLDPRLAHDGLSGKAIYLAESAVKMDRLHDLHSTLRTKSFTCYATHGGVGKDKLLPYVVNRLRYLRSVTEPAPTSETKRIPKVQSMHFTEKITSCLVASMHTGTTMQWPNLEGQANVLVSGHTI